jgi:SAM-dependent methyltransferase
MRPLRRARAVVRDRIANIVRQEMRQQTRVIVQMAAQVAEARLSDASRLASTVDHTKNPTDEFYATLADRLRAAGVRVKDRDVDISAFVAWMESYPAMCEQYVDPSVGMEKRLEHYLSWDSTRPMAGDRYLDVAAAGSCWASCLRNAGVKALSVDLSYPGGVHGCRIGADAQAVPLPANSVDTMSAQCAFECFQGEADIGFIREAARLVRPGGRLAIVPLHVDDTHFIATSPYTIVDRSEFDEGATVVWRDDEYDEPFSRHYSPEALLERLGEALGLFSDVTVVHVTNLDALRDHWPESRLYAYFMLECTK